MRLVAIDGLNDTMRLGRTIYGANGEVLLNAGTILQERYIARVKQLNFSAVYVEDAFSEGIDVHDVISSELRQDTIRSIKNVFSTVSKPDEKQIQRFAQETNMLVKNITDQVMTNRDMIINMMDLKSFDSYTFQHCVNVSILATVLAVAMGKTHKEVLEITTAAMFHDIGMMFIPRELVNKPTLLTEEEKMIVSRHAKQGYEFASRYLPFKSTVLVTILQHHERYNGMGYPLGFKGAQIPEYARIISICDVFDAMTSDKPYRKAILPSEAVEYIMANEDEHFSKEVISIFLRKVAAYPTGLTVELSNGLTGVICGNKENLPLRPQVKIFTRGGNSEAAVIDLSDADYSSVTIVGVIR